MLDYSDAHKLASKITNWYFDNYSYDLPKIAQRDKQRYPDHIWSKLLVEAISAFSEGLDNLVEPEHKRADISHIVGEEALSIIAFLVSAAGTQIRRPVEFAVEMFDKNILKTPLDKQTYNQAMQIIAGEQFLWDDQAQVFQAHKQLQKLSATSNIAPDLAKFLGWISAKYMERADELTRASAGMPGQAPQFMGDLPTGIRIGRRYR